MVNRVFRTALLFVPLISASLAFAANPAADDQTNWSAVRYSRASSTMPGLLFGETAVGALTLDSVYSFDFASAGMGQVVFRRAAYRAPLYVSTDVQAMSVASSVDEAPRFSGLNFGVPSSSSAREGLVRAFIESPEPGGDDAIAPFAPVPEPTTWIGAALALVAIAFTQRRKLRGLNARA